MCQKVILLLEFYKFAFQWTWFKNLLYETDKLGLNNPLLVPVWHWFSLCFQMCTPANTPATPPNFPDALAMFSRLKASESFGNSSPIASMATSPAPHTNWAMSPPATPGHQGRWTPGPLMPQAPSPGWPAAVTQQASAEHASIVMEAGR